MEADKSKKDRPIETPRYVSYSNGSFVEDGPELYPFGAGEFLEDSTDYFIVPVIQAAFGGGHKIANPLEKEEKSKEESTKSNSTKVDESSSKS